MVKDRQLEREHHPAASGITRREFIYTGSGAVIGAALTGCGGDDKKEQKAANSDIAPKGSPWAGTKEAVSLIDSVHLADISHYGQFVDFGTAARFKYTLGGWMSGWDNDTAMNGMSYTWASKSPSRGYFTVSEAKPLTIVIHAKKGGVSTFSVYLNDHPLTRVSLKGNDFEEHRIQADAEKVVPGENLLKLVYQTSTKEIGGKPASIAIDYIRIIPEGEDLPEGKPFEPPHIDGLRQTYKVGDQEHPVLMLPLPTTLSYYLQVPPSGSLCFAAAAAVTGADKKAPDASLKVTAVPVDGGRESGLLSKNYSGRSWHHETLDLSKLAGKLVKIDIAATGGAGGRLALGAPAIRFRPPQITASDKKKNVIVLLIDTLRADKLTAYNKTWVKSPVFDKFVKESSLFERCQAPSNWTKPSCASVLTGLYPDSHKARGHSSKVASSIKLASEIFRTFGFATGAFIANGYLAAEFGFKRGWNQYVNFIRENKKTDAENVFKTSLDFIADHKDKPFFTYIQTIDPHVPYDPPEEDLKRYDARPYEGPVQNRSTGNLLEEIKRDKITLNARDKKRLEALYDGEVTYHDRYFGHFLDSLKKMGVLDNTVIVVCADHGEEFFEHESVGHGHTLFQELLHVPLVLRAPGVVPAGRRIKAEAGLADILPTALKAAGLEIPAGLEGRDLLPVCNGAVPDPMEASFSSFFSEKDERNLSWSVRKGDFKLRMKGPARTYLYNLADDPREQTDVDVKYPLALRALRIALGQFIAAPNKREWQSRELALHAVSPKSQSETAEVPEDLRDQLRALGYMQ